MLASRLAEKNSNIRYEVINAGISGFNSQFALSRLKDELLDYEPDMVTIYIGWNDLMKINPINPDATGRHSTLARILNQSYLVKAYSKFIFFYLRPLVMKPKLTGDPIEATAFDMIEVALGDSTLRDQQHGIGLGHQQSREVNQSREHRLRQNLESRLPSLTR